LLEWEFHDFSAKVIGINKSKVECRNKYVTQIEILLRTKHETTRQRSPQMPLGQIWRQQHNNGKLILEQTECNRFYMVDIGSQMLPSCIKATYI